MAEATLVLGLDVGGSTSRALVAARDGRRHGTGRSGGGNPTARDALAAAAAIEAAVGEALRGTDPGLLAGVTVGLAGGGMLTTTPAAAEAFERMWERTGISCPVAYVPDALVAFVAGTPEPDGSMLLAGTGAVGLAITAGRVTAHADGNGWLLGDRGSGFWLAREAVVAVLAELDGTGPATALTSLVVAALGGSGRGFGGLDVIVAATARLPDGLAELAPLVTAAHADGDPVAVRIVDRAVEHLLATLASVRASDAATPIVLSGSVLIRPTPVAVGVRRGIAERWPGAEVAVAADGAAGAAWLALCGLPGGAEPGSRERLFPGSGYEVVPPLENALPRARRAADIVEITARENVTVRSERTKSESTSSTRT